MNVTPTEFNTINVLRLFLQGASLIALPTQTVEIVKGQANRVPEVKSDDFVVMTPRDRWRLATNIDLSGDVKFTGAIAGTTLTVSSITTGAVGLGTQLFGVGVSANTIIQSQLTGTSGSVGTYAVSVSQNVDSRVLSAGINNLLQETEYLVQLDVHGPNSADNAQIITTIMRDQYATDQFAQILQNLSLPAGTIDCLYAESKGQIPFTNDQAQAEYRWVIEVHLQINPTVSVPQQFADGVAITLVEIDSQYPP